MNDTQFIEKYCHNCGTQRCEGIGTEWFEGCSYRWNHDSYDAATEIKRLNEKVMELANKLIKITNEKLPAADVAPVAHGEWVDIISCEDIIYATCNLLFKKSGQKAARLCK